MTLINKNILLISPEPWNHIFVSKHHYATHLVSRGNKVFFLNPPSGKTECSNTDHTNLFSVNYKGFIRGLRFLPSFIQKLFIRKKFVELQKLCQTQFDIVWSFDNSVFFDFSALPKQVYCISHIVDLNQDFEFTKSTSTADVCLTTSKIIFNKQKKYNSKSHNIGHGYNLNPASIDQKMELPGNYKIKCGYAGNLDIEYLDWDLLENLLNSFPEVGFYFAGAWNKNENFQEKIISKINFNYLGRLPSENLPFFYRSTDILLVVYQYKKYGEQLSNPHKMMEYLGSGKPIIATWMDEYLDLLNNDLIIMVKNKEKFMIEANRLFENLPDWNNELLSNKRRSIAKNNSYDNQINKIENFINN